MQFRSCDVRRLAARPDRRSARHRTTASPGKPGDASSASAGLQVQVDMNLRVMDRRLAVDQHVDGVAGMGAVDLRDIDPVGGGRTRRASRRRRCRPAASRIVRSGLPPRAPARHRRRRRMELRRQRREVECVALGENVVGDMGDRRGRRPHGRRHWRTRRCLRRRRRSAMPPPWPASMASLPAAAVPSGPGNRLSTSSLARSRDWPAPRPPRRAAAARRRRGRCT